jgi:SpoVK/Ycf46/Vps4 family AAA+-type ATPase
MDGIEGREKVVIFGATNRPDILDKALIRPGRFDRLIYIPPPDMEARIEIFKINLKKMKIGDDVDITTLALATNGFSGADISKVCREAGMFALSEDINSESVKDCYFKKAINITKSSITKEMIEYFNSFSLKTDL